MNTNGVKQVLSLAERRMRLFTNGYRMRQETVPVTFVDGQSVDIVLPKAGVGLLLYITIRATISQIVGGGGGIASTLGLPTWVQRVTLTDASGNTRISASGVALSDLQRVSKWANNEPASADAGVYDYAIPAAGASELWKLQLIVPISMGDYDSRGALPLALPSGQTRLNIQFAPLATVGSIFSPVNATAATTDFTMAGGTINCTVEYIEPRANDPLPNEDFGLVHEIVTLTDNANLAASTEKRILLPTGRTYRRAIGHLFGDNGAGASVLSEDVNRVAFYINGSTPVTNDTYAAYQGILAKKLGLRLDGGHYLWDWQDRQYSPNDFGELAIALALDAAYAAGAGDRFDVTWDCMYKLASVGAV